MKTQLKTTALVVFFVLVTGSLLAQAPQSFSFQAVARNSSNQLISSTNISVRLTLIAKSDASIVWQETHNTMTSDMGLFVVDFGKGTRTAGSASTFDAIDWGGDQYSAKIEINLGSSWEDMGTSDIQSVPYALSAATVGKLKSLSVVEGANNPLDTALFEVKNKNGQTVFAVYNEGVRVYVDDNPGKSKGPKGGFAIGGFDNTKGTTFEFFRVTPDSVRIYLDEGATKGPKGGFAIGGFNRTKGFTADLMHLTEDNYFIGYGSGSKITTGLYNSFFGYLAGAENSSGSGNVFIGNETGYSNVGGNWNIFMGNSVGYSNTSGSGNIVLGDGAGYNNTTGSWNVFLGDLAGQDNTVGESNVFIGSDAGLSNTIGNYNVFLGSSAGYNNTDGTSNVFLGESSGISNISGGGNVFLGTESGNSNSIGNYNVFLGESTGWANTTGSENVFLGTSAGAANSTGWYNVFIGTVAGEANTTGSGNVYIGQETGQVNTVGDLNVAVGALAGANNILGSGNIFIGAEAGFYETGSNTLYIDNGGNTWDESLIFGDFFLGEVWMFADQYVAGDVSATNVYTASDVNLKKNITDMPSMLDKVMQLHPVEFDWKSDSGIKGVETAGRQTGLIAQEVEKIFPEAVKINRKGMRAVNYTQLSVAYLKALQEQQQVITTLQQENQALRKSVDELTNRVNAITGVVVK